MGSERTETCWNGGLRELLREREKRVLRGAHPRTPFQGEYPPGYSHTNPSQYLYLHKDAIFVIENPLEMGPVDLRKFWKAIFFFEGEKS